jgi:hypothetical protein
MSDLFREVQEITRELIRAANELAYTALDARGRRQLVADARQQLRLLEGAIDRRLTLGLAVPLTRHWHAGPSAWQYDVREVLEELREDAAALVEAAAAVPPYPVLAPGEQFTDAHRGQWEAHLQAQEDVGRIAVRLRALEENRLLTLAGFVDTSAPAAPAAGPPPFKLGRGGRSCVWGARKFFFTDMQGDIVRQLWRAFKNGTQDVSQGALLEKAGSGMDKPNLKKLFKGHEAWGTLIVPGATKGTYRLAGPPS